MNMLIAFLERTTTVGTVVVPYGLIVALTGCTLAGVALGNMIWRMSGGDRRTARNIELDVAERIAARHQLRQEDSWKVR